VVTHLLGFLLFLCLTVATVRLRPAPPRLGAAALAALEERLAAVRAGGGSLLDLVEAGGGWERSARALGGEARAALAAALDRAAGPDLGESIAEALRWAEAEVAAVEGAAGRAAAAASGRARGAGAALARAARAAGAELSSAERRAAAAGSAALSTAATAARGGLSAARRELSDLEAAAHRALAAALPGAAWPAARWPIHVFTAGAMACLLISAACHLFGCCAPHAAALMWRFDYAGIAVLIVASMFPPVVYGFACAPGARAFYLATASALGAATLAATLAPRFQRPEWHARRAALFVALGAFGAVPLLHMVAAHAGGVDGDMSGGIDGGFDGGYNGAFGNATAAAANSSGPLAALGRALARVPPELARAARLDAAMGAIYVAGAGVYAARVPERWRPGAFDVAFHSHQLFHVAVVVAAAIHYRASGVLLAWRDATGGCLPA
jgi:predicted membrane channel-forming protein YqfA (hemolysin III family)